MDLQLIKNLFRSIKRDLKSMALQLISEIS